MRDKPVHKLCELWTSSEDIGKYSFIEPKLSTGGLSNLEIDKRIYKHFIQLLLGVALFLFGFTNLLTSFTAPRTISDQEVINRAKGLGLVEMKDVYKKSLEEEKAPTTNTNK